MHKDENQQERQIKTALADLRCELEETLTTQKSFAANELTAMRLYWKEDQDLSRALLQLEDANTAYCQTVIDRAEEREEALRLELRGIQNVKNLLAERGEQDGL